MPKLIYNNKDLFEFIKANLNSSLNRLLIFIFLIDSNNSS